jgi:hypothetical protein
MRPGGASGEEVSQGAEVAQQLGLQVPAAALADEGHGQQLAVGAPRRRAGAMEQRGDRRVEVIH